MFFRDFPGGFDRDHFSSASSAFTQPGPVTSFRDLPDWPDLLVADAAEGSREIGQIVGID